MIFLDYALPTLIGLFFIFQYFNNKLPIEKKKKFLLIGFLIVILNLIRIAIA